MGRVILVVISSLVTIFVLVVVDRGLGLVLNRGYFKAMWPGKWQMETNEFKVGVNISQQGLREEGAIGEKRKKRMLALGDSFTFGWGVELKQSWPKLLEREEMAVVNAGVPGIGLGRINLVCQAYVDRLAVDGFILGVYADDFFQAVAEKGERQDWWPTLRRLRRPVIESAKEDRRSWKAGVEQSLLKEPTILLRLDPDIRGDFLQGKINPFMVWRAFTDPEFLLYPVEAAYVHEAAGALGEEMKKLKTECTRERPVVAVFIPPSVMVAADYFPFQRALGYLIDERLLLVDMDKWLRPMVETEGFEYVSMLTDFRRDGCPGCYFPYDGHLTVEGNRRVAELVAPKLEKLIKESD